MRTALRLAVLLNVCFTKLDVAREPNRSGDYFRQLARFRAPLQHDRFWSSPAEGGRWRRRLGAMSEIFALAPDGPWAGSLRPDGSIVAFLCTKDVRPTFGKDGIGRVTEVQPARARGGGAGSGG